MSKLAVTQRPVNPLLQKYLESLVLRPVLTKAITSGILNFAQENLASYLAKSPAPPYEKTGILPIDAIKSNSRAFKLAAYGFFISAPLQHFMTSTLQKSFAGQAGARAKIGQILASNLIMSPITAVVYLSSLAVINGATSVTAVKKFVRMAIFGVLKIMWVTNPLSLAFAQQFLSPETWVPFFNLISFSLGTVINVKTKKQAIAARAKAQAKKDAEEKSKGA